MPLDSRKRSFLFCWCGRAFDPQNRLFCCTVFMPLVFFDDICCSFRCPISILKAILSALSGSTVTRSNSLWISPNFVIKLSLTIFFSQFFKLQICSSFYLRCCIIVQLFHLSFGFGRRKRIDERLYFVIDWKLIRAYPTIWVFKDRKWLHEEFFVSIRHSFVPMLRYSREKHFWSHMVCLTSQQRIAASISVWHFSSLRHFKWLFWYFPLVFCVLSFNFYWCFIFWFGKKFYLRWFGLEKGIQCYVFWCQNC